MSDALYHATSPRAALACLAGALAFAAWLTARGARRYAAALDRAATG